jgi:hypothetical protein
MMRDWKKRVEKIVIIIDLLDSQNQYFKLEAIQKIQTYIAEDVEVTLSVIGS